MRSRPERGTSRAVRRALAQLNAAARSGDSASFFETARKELLQAFAARWRMSPDQVTASELEARLGKANREIQRLFALADEAKYSDHEPGATDFQGWLRLVRSQLKDGAE